MKLCAGMAPSGRVTPHSVGRCREATEGPGRVSGPADRRVGERACDLTVTKGFVSPSVSFADSSLTEGAFVNGIYFYVHKSFAIYPIDILHHRATILAVEQIEC